MYINIYMAGVAGQHSNISDIRTRIPSAFPWYRSCDKHIFVINKGANEQIKH